VTKLERAKAIGDYILSLPESIWKPANMGDIDASVIVQPGWSAVQTAKFPEGSPEWKEGSAVEEEGSANDFAFSFILDVWVAGRGKVLSLDYGLEERLISMRSGSWEKEIFGVGDNRPC
jgi:hypothetical protein